MTAAATARAVRRTPAVARVSDPRTHGVNLLVTIDGCDKVAVVLVMVAAIEQLNV